MIRQCGRNDIEIIYSIVNESAKAYDGFIPVDCYHQPYMSLRELEREMKRMTFFGWEEETVFVAVMALEQVKDVTLIRHAYVLPRRQGNGLGTLLLHHILSVSVTPDILVGTWAGATWAIDFYKKQGFSLVADKDRLLKTYWDIPARQIETSVVLGIRRRLPAFQDNT